MKTIKFIVKSLVIIFSIIAGAFVTHCIFMFRGSVATEDPIWEFIAFLVITPLVAGALFELIMTLIHNNN